MSPEQKWEDGAPAAGKLLSSHRDRAASPLVFIAIACVIFEWDSIVEWRWRDIVMVGGGQEKIRKICHLPAIMRQLRREIEN